MANAKLELSYQYMTATKARKRLGLSRFRFDFRIKRGVLPGPTFTDITGVRYFDENWVRNADTILHNSGGNNHE